LVIKKKSVTTHGNMNVKNAEELGTIRVPHRVT